MTRNQRGREKEVVGGRRDRSDNELECRIRTGTGCTKRLGQGDWDTESKDTEWMRSAGMKTGTGNHQGWGM